MNVLKLLMIFFMLGFLTACPGLESPILEFPNYQIKLETSTLTIYGEQQIDVKVNVLRSNGFADPINVVLASLPGITAEPITIPGEASSGVLVVKASVDVVQSDLPVPLNVQELNIYPIHIDFQKKVRVRFSH